MVIVTFNREVLLQRLLDSIDQMIVKPTSVVIVNNASTDQTEQSIAHWANRHREFAVEVVTQVTNTGGAGGFRTGIQSALATGASWIWVMDDDVEVVPDALQSAAKWFKQFDAFMGRRLTNSGEIVNWAHRLSDRTGLAPLFPQDPFSKSDFVESNSGCFEGMFISSQAVIDIGLPDPRFFITWDDAVYGWLLARRHKVAYVKDVFLRRTLEMKSVGPTTVRIYARNNLSRYFFIRNRAIQARYFEREKRLRKVWFALGTFRVIIIEVARMMLVERDLRNLPIVFRATRDGFALLGDPEFFVPYDGE
jgi:GT2 family glycosyltransferase